MRLLLCACVCVSVCLCVSVCRSICSVKRKTALAINKLTKVGRYILHGKLLINIDPENKRSEVTGSSGALLAWVCRSIQLHIFLVIYCYYYFANQEVEVLEICHYHYLSSSRFS